VQAVQNKTINYSALALLSLRNLLSLLGTYSFRCTLLLLLYTYSLSWL